MSSARHLVAKATERLAAAGIGTPRVDAELLLAALLGTSRTSAMLRTEVRDPVRRTYAEWVARREDREPLQHIVGDAAFRHVVVSVGPGVFVPRPETELLVDAVLPELRATTDPLAVDLCSGSGALAASLADEVTGARVVALERSHDALRWLARNVPAAVRVVAGDVRDPDVLRELYGQVDAVVSNPPYVPDATPVEPEVRADPHDAVFAGADGLDLIPVVVARAALLLRAGGVFAMEHDSSHAAAVLALFADDPGWTDVAGHDDLTGRPRYVTARRTDAVTAG